ncbi:MAG TPA: RsmD family RNA methyltransferase [Pirellulales bacterium]|nr:RsmD family RNA methyltransferase [Pirellulales bacterium]
MPHRPANMHPVSLRIIGGTLRGRKLEYGGQPRTRPMKDRVREAVFNLLGPHVAGKLAVDLFAGTGALGLEALSRGAIRAVFFEQHFPTAELIRRNARTLGVESQVEVVAADTFIRFRRTVDLATSADPDLGWVVFCSPPFEFYARRRDDMLSLVGTLLSAAPPQSQFVIEADNRFDFGVLPQAAAWLVREYPPARVGIWPRRRTGGEAGGAERT